MKMARFFLLGLVTLAAGCINLKQTVTINRDGSGAVDIAYSMSEQTIAQLKAMLKLQDQMAVAAGEAAPTDVGTQFAKVFMDPNETKIQRKIAEYAESGVRITKLKTQSRNAGRFVELKLAFDSLAAIMATDFFREYGFSLKKTDEGRYTLSRPPAVDPGQDLMINVDPSDPETVKALTPILGGFHMNLQIKTPGTIVNTTAHRKSLYTAIWNFDFDQDPRALMQLQKQAFDITFEGKGLSLPESTPTAAGS